MLNSKFDQIFEERCVRAIEWLEANPLAVAPADRLREEAIKLLKIGHQSFVEVRDKAQRGYEKHRCAARDLARSNKVSEQAFQTIYYRMQARGYELRAQGRQQFEEFEAASKAAFGRLTPSAFGPLRIALSLRVLEKATDFAAIYLGNDDPDVLNAREAHEHLEECRSLARTGESEYAMAANALFAARDIARVYYTSARDVVGAAFRLAHINNLNRVLPSIYNIYNRNTAPQDMPVDDTAPNDDKPTPNHHDTNASNPLLAVPVYDPPVQDKVDVN